MPAKKETAPLDYGMIPMGQPPMDPWAMQSRMGVGAYDNPQMMGGGNTSRMTESELLQRELAMQDEMKRMREFQAQEAARREQAAIAGLPDAQRAEVLRQLTARGLY